MSSGPQALSGPAATRAVGDGRDLRRQTGWFRHVAFCSPCPYAISACSALPPAVPAASDDVELIPELPSPGMLMTDDTHGATGTTVIDGRLILLRPPVAVVAPRRRGHRVPFSLHTAAACRLQPTSVSALSSRATGPHVWRHRSRPSPTALAAAGLDSACGPDIAGFQPGNAGLSPEDCAGFYSGSSE